MLDYCNFLVYVLRPISQNTMGGVRLVSSVSKFNHLIVISELTYRIILFITLTALPRCCASTFWKCYKNHHQRYVVCVRRESAFQYSTDTEGCVSINFLRHSLDDSQTTHLTQAPSPSLNTAELIVIHNHPCKHSSKLQLYIRFTTSRCLGV